MSHYYTPIGGLGIANLGQAVDELPANGTALAPTVTALRPTIARRGLLLWGSLFAVSIGASAYHGYKRSRGSTGAAVGWGLLGGIFPIITPAVALAQGFGKPKTKRNRRRRTSRRKR